MKYLFLLVLLIPATVGFSQYLDAPTKKSNTIVIIKKSEQPEDIFKNVVNLILDEGWEIEHSDNKLLTIRSNWKKGKGFIVYHLQYSISIRPKDNGITEVHLKGKAKNPSLYEIEKRTAAGKYWGQMHTFAEKIGSDFKYK